MIVLDEAKTKASKLFSGPFYLSKRDVLRSTELDLFSGLLGDKGASVLSQALLVGALPKLEELWLRNNQIGDEGCKALAEHLPTSLERLYLDYNQIGDEGCKALAEHLPTNLQTLGLHGSQVGDEGCKALAEHLPTRLKVLELGGNQIGDEGCKALAKHLPASLKTLWLWDNQIGDEGCKALAKHLPTASLRLLCVGFEHQQLKAACRRRDIQLLAP